MYCLFVASVCSAQDDDKIICNRIFSYAFEHKLYDKPIGDVVVAVGKRFIGAPYAPHTLDIGDTEHLVVNLREFDCVTFVESSLALARCIKRNRLSYQAFEEELRLIRYRHGRINGYPSRLHYFSDWIIDNQQKDIVLNPTKEFGATQRKGKIEFMSKHRELYPQLSDDSVFNKITIVEDSLSAREMTYIPKNRIREVESRIHDGDIIAITTSIDGLDVSHTGIAVRASGGGVHLLHAPDVKGSVRLTEETLAAHLARNHSQSGIIIIRPVDTGGK